jgi:hypothetical protein
VRLLSPEMMQQQIAGRSQISVVRPSWDILTGGVGLTIKCRDDIAFCANYDAIIRAGNTPDQTVSAGLRIRF